MEANPEEQHVDANTALEMVIRGDGEEIHEPTSLIGVTPELTLNQRNNNSIMVRKWEKNFDAFKKNYGIPSYITLSKCKTDDEVRGIFPEGCDDTSASLSALAMGGMTLPISDLLGELCQLYGIIPVQLPLHSHRIVAGVLKLNEVLKDKLESPLGLKELVACYGMLQPQPGTNTKSTEPYLHPINHYELVTGLHDSNRGYTQDMVVVSGSWRPANPAIVVPRAPGKIKKDPVQIKNLGKPCKKDIEYVLNWWGESGNDPTARDAQVLLGYVNPLAYTPNTECQIGKKFKQKEDTRTRGKAEKPSGKVKKSVLPHDKRPPQPSSFSLGKHGHLRDEPSDEYEIEDASMDRKSPCSSELITYELRETSLASVLNQDPHPVQELVDDDLKVLVERVRLDMKERTKRKAENLARNKSSAKRVKESISCKGGQEFPVNTEVALLTECSFELDVPLKVPPVTAESSRPKKTPLEGVGECSALIPIDQARASPLTRPPIHTIDGRYATPAEVMDATGVTGIFDRSPNAGLLAFSALQQFPGDVPKKESDYSQIVAHAQSMIPQGLVYFNMALAHQVNRANQYSAKAKKYYDQFVELEKKFKDAETRASNAESSKAGIEEARVEACRDKVDAQRERDTLRDKVAKLEQDLVTVKMAAEKRERELEDGRLALVQQNTEIEANLKESAEKLVVVEAEAQKKLMDAIRRVKGEINAKSMVQFNKFYVQGWAESAKFARMPPEHKIWDIENIILPIPDSDVPELKPLSPREDSDPEGEEVDEEQ